MIVFPKEMKFYLDLFLNESDTTYAYYKTVTINDVSSSESYSYTINDVTTNGRQPNLLLQEVALVLPLLFL